jgi:acyl-CoA synthetase (AMP-forming)/AMP-acid ligase II
VLTAGRLVDCILRSDAARGASVAVVDGDDEVTYSELSNRVADRADLLELDARSLVVLTGDRSVEFVISYLALLDGGHVPLLAGDHVDDLARSWGAAAVIESSRESFDITRRRHEPMSVHPDLALLLSTSGSTGSPKLVRLSHTNLSSNASAIAEYLDLGARDTGISSLPLHYCYGLSVLHSHLLAGASMVMCDASVVDPCFRVALERHGVTNVAGVPHTFDLLDRADPDRLFVPSLRFVTQAGGRLPPEAVRRWIGLSETRGVDFYVMYGQTEATARMAYLRPEDGARYPSAIGRPIPGGSFALRPVEGCDDDVGELMYRGQNVMLGYAERPGDLASDRAIEELATGDLARYDAVADVYEIVGRASRFVKPFGVRIDLDEIETWLRGQLGDSADVAAGGTDERVVVVAAGADPAVVRALVRERTKLPAGALSVDNGAVPRTSSGKVDYGALTRVVPGEAAGAQRATASAVFADVFELDALQPDETFVSLGGDSLSYIECSIRLENALGRLPTDWHLMPVGTLDQLTLSRHRRLARVDTTVVLRALAICAVVSTHMRLRFVPGGAHILLAVVGFNLARFMMPIESTRDRVRSGLRTVARVAVPTVVWVWCAWFLGASYGIGTVLLLNNYIGPPGHRGDHWHFWFIEVFVHLILIVTALLAVPSIRRLERRFQYAFPLVLFGFAMLLQMEWAWMGDWYNIRFRTHSIAFFFVLGWLIQRSDTTRKRFATSALCIVSIADFFDYAPREWFIGVCLVGLVWLREAPVPRLVVRPVAILASASMWILISHFTVWPLAIDVLPLGWAYVATLVAGVLVWVVAERVIEIACALARITAKLPTRRRPSTFDHPTMATT